MKYEDRVELELFDLSFLENDDFKEDQEEDTFYREIDELLLEWEASLRAPNQN